jgi:hypothetical protein
MLKYSLNLLTEDRVGFRREWEYPSGKPWKRGEGRKEPRRILTVDVDRITRSRRKSIRRKEGEEEHQVGTAYGLRSVRMSGNMGRKNRSSN